METRNLLERFDAGMPNCSPTLKLVWMVLLLALKDEAGSVRFSRKQDKIVTLWYTPKNCGVCEMIPPPRHLFSCTMHVLHQMGRQAAKNPDSAIAFSYSETGEEETLVLSIDHSKGEGVRTELRSLLLEIYAEEQAEEQLEEIQRRGRARKRQWIAATIFLVAISAVGGLAWYLFFQ